LRSLGEAVTGADITPDATADQMAQPSSDDTALGGADAIAKHISDAFAKLTTEPLAEHDASADVMSQ
jgi:hypothetical protein